MADEKQSRMSAVPPMTTEAWLAEMKRLEDAFARDLEATARTLFSEAANDE